MTEMNRNPKERSLQAAGTAKSLTPPEKSELIYENGRFCSLKAALLSPSPALSVAYRGTNFGF